MKTEKLNQQCKSYLRMLSEDIQDRSVGSEGNRRAIRLFERVASSFGWHTETPEFDVIDWKDGKATLQANDENFKVLASPYSLGCSVKNTLVSASSINELEQLDADGKVLLLRGEIAKEQLMPKNFVFYNPEEHQKIIAMLEEKKPAAIITATGRNAALAGGVYPFPLIEDGDFDIPSVYMTEEEGEKLLPYVGKQVSVESFSKRIPSKAYNVIARRGINMTERIVITAHIDSKKGMPGALDNATGVTVLLLLAELLQDYNESNMIEIVALNGEDHYAIPGQMNYLSSNQGRFNEIILNINIDGVGYRDGKSAFSFFNLPEGFKGKANELVTKYSGILEGIQWPQGDHSMFIQNGSPAIAVTSQWFIENMNTQTITHTLRDNTKVVDCRKVVEVVQALDWFLRR